MVVQELNQVGVYVDTGAEKIFLPIEAVDQQIDLSSLFMK